MAYDNIVSRTDAAALMPEEVSNAILGGLANESAALTLFKQIRMARGQMRLPVLSALPTAYFVSGDTGLKQTTEANWANKYLNAEELACIVPIPDAVLEDMEFDAWAETIPLVQQAIGRALDAAIFFGTNKPASWPAAIVAAAIAAGNTVTEGTNAAAAGGLAGDFSALFGTLEADGYDVNGIVATTAVKGRLRQARSTQGVQLAEVSEGDIYGVAPRFPMRGLWPTGAAAAEAVAGDFTQGLLGIRRDITIDRSNEAIVQDNTGAIIYNAFQQDMTLVRVTARFAFQVANTINYDQAVEANRYPFAVLRTA
jgi:HK97 family phage major capsid protein